MYQRLIGFAVATPVLERSFRNAYGLELDALFGDVDLAIGTYRCATSRLIPDVTRAAWRDKRDEILNGLADETYDDLLARHADQKFCGISPQLRADITAHFGTSAAGQVDGGSRTARDNDI